MVVVVGAAGSMVGDAEFPAASAFYCLALIFDATVLFYFGRSPGRAEGRPAAAIVKSPAYAGTGLPLLPVYKRDGSSHEKA